MARQLVLEISETAEYLEKSLKQAKSSSQKERLQMLWWLKKGEALAKLQQRLRSSEGFSSYQAIS